MKTLKQQEIIIDKLDFNTPGKILLKLHDGRVLITPIVYFPAIKKMKLQERNQYTIVDDRTILFRNSDEIYHIEDFMGLEEKWRQR
jgi:hypothetical protein